MHWLKTLVLVLGGLVFVALIPGVASRLVFAVLGLLPVDSLKETVRRQAVLSNGGTLEVRGREYNGPHGVPYFWDAVYRSAPDARMEKIGFWGGGSPTGDLVACPVGTVVVVVPFRGNVMFARSAEGRWKSFDMTLPGKAPASELPRYAGATSLTIEELHRLDPLYEASGRGPDPRHIPSFLMQFRAGRRELTVDYVLSVVRTFRLRLELSADGERLRLLSAQEESEKRYPPVLDVPRDAGCVMLEMFPRSPA